jgi:predicted amidohydrolase
MKIGLAQIKPYKGDISQNIDLHLNWIRKAVEEKVDLIVFPELSLTGYEPELAHELAMEAYDPRLNTFQQISDHEGISIALGAPTRAENGILISMLIFQADKPMAIYSKQLLHSDEKPYFIEGDFQFILSQNGIQIAPAICYESLQKSHVLRAKELNADIYLASVAKPQKGIEKANEHFPKIAQELGIHVLMVNSVGLCDNFLSTGQSAAWNQDGKLISRLNSKDYQLLIIEVPK